MGKFKLGLLALILGSTLLTGCGSQLTGTYPASGISIFNAEQPKKENNLDTINQAIDFATSTKNTTNNFNLKFYMDGKNAYPALENLILNAKESLYIEVFIFNNDYTGRKFAEALVSKAKEGVEVKILYDFFGNIDVNLMNYMAKNGVHIETYNGQLISKTGVNITHRKVYIADGLRAMTGGMNMGEKYEHEWHDTMMGYEGEAVRDTLKEFIADWKRAGNKPSKLMLETVAKPIDIADGKKVPVRVTVTSPKEAGKEEDIKRMMIAAIDSAKDNVKVAFPYFSDDEFIKHLIFAQSRGVKVSALIPKTNDQALMEKVSINTSNQLIKGNVEVFKTGAKDNSFSHSKVITVDNVWTTIGSCNADFRAFHENQELNIGISDPEFTEEVNRVFFDFHIQNSEKGVYKNIPWYKKPFYSLLESIDDLF